MVGAAGVRGGEGFITAISAICLWSLHFRDNRLSFSVLQRSAPARRGRNRAACYDPGSSPPQIVHGYIPAFRSASARHSSAALR